MDSIRVYEYGRCHECRCYDLSVIRYMADRIAVMCAGRFVETAPREVLLRNPVHPYSEALPSAVPKAAPRARASRDPHPRQLYPLHPREPFPRQSVV